MSFLFLVSVVLFPVRSRCVFFSCHRIISHDRIYAFTEIRFFAMLLLYSSHQPIGPQPYPVIYVVANPVRGHKEVIPRSTGHIIMVTTRYSDQQGSKSRQKVMRLYKRWHRPITKRFIKTSFTPYREQPRSTRIVVAYPRPAFSATNRTDTFQSVLINIISKFLKATHRTKIRKFEIPRSMVVERP